MSTVKHKHSRSAGETESIAEAIGRNLKGGEVIELISDLGGGKTTFVRGLARGAKSFDHVASPTFTLSRVYSAPSFDIQHFDFYRLEEPGIMAAELAEASDDERNVVVIEWAHKVQHVLPADRLTITIKQTVESERELVFSCPPRLQYLLKEID